MTSFFFLDKMVIFAIFVPKSHHADILGTIWKPKQLSFKWDQTQLCSFIRLRVIPKNIIYTINVEYLDNRFIDYICFVHLENELSRRAGIGPKWKRSN